MAKAYKVVGIHPEDAFYDIKDKIIGIEVTGVRGRFRNFIDSTVEGEFFWFEGVVNDNDDYSKVDELDLTDGRIHFYAVELEEISG